MSEIKKLIERLCPDGVAFKKLGEIGTFTRGNGLQKKDFTEVGFPCIHYGQIYTQFGLYTDKTLSYCSPDLAFKLVKAKTGDMIIACTSENVDDVCKSVVWLGEGEVATGGHACVFSHNQEPKYVAYFFRSEQFFAQKKRYAKGVKVIDIKISDLEKIEIPVPPLEVQSKIVEILDDFTELEAELEVKIEAELEARRKQYEYYRNQLLSFENSGQNNVKWMTLGEVCDFQNGFAFKSTLFKPEGLPIIRITNITGNFIDDSDMKFFDLDDYDIDFKQYKVCQGDILIAMSGATTGKIGCSLKKQIYYINQRVGKFIPHKVLNRRYLFHFLSTKSKYIYYLAGGGAQPNLSSNKLLNELIIPIPPSEEQERIVSILDRFEALTTDLQSGLPAEIEARRKQYEYYREQLLTFKRKVV